MTQATRRLTIALLAGVLVGAGPALAQPSPTAADVIQLAVRQDGRTPFKAVRSQQVTRQDNVYHAGAKVDFRDGTNYQIALAEPKEIDGINLMIDKAKLTAFFPRESLLFSSDVSAPAEEVKDLVLGKLTDDPALLMSNYNVTLAPELDVVALYPCYKLTLVPKRGLGAGSPPAHRFWVAKETGLVMKEERYWSDDIPAYFISEYSDFSTTRKPLIKLDVPGTTSKLKLAAGTPTTMARYRTAEAAKAAGKQVYLPTVVAPGFKLRAIDIMEIYGTDIVLLRYYDGVSNAVVTYRAKPLAFVALLAGANALNLVGKISTLSYHAPNNYAIAEKGNTVVYGYGDLYTETLQNMAASVPLPVEQKPKP